MQKITYEEFLPALGVEVSPYEVRIPYLRDTVNLPIDVNENHQCTSLASRYPRFHIHSLSSDGLSSNGSFET